MATIKATDDQSKRHAPIPTGLKGHVHSITSHAKHPGLSTVTVDHGVDDGYGGTLKSEMHLPADHAATMRVGDKVMHSLTPC